MMVVVADVAVTVGVGELMARLSWCQILLSYIHRHFEKNSPGIRKYL